ncbi:putative mfs efflux protein [Botryosphaeria dothidea]|uniref:Mfs efflux protein n=1 Tax=Botryosphaeria dothidea TaxID=55169 RepID=A0A8H4J471_9PEZI|nr:putative mfs efflux protein [Botryosphaeria dothidea]
MAHALGNLFDIEDPKRITTPPLTRKKSVSIRAPPSNQELDDLIFGDPLSGPQTHPSTPKHADNTPFPSGAQTPVTPGELEGTGNNPPAAAPLIQTLWNPPMNKYRVLCACLVYFGNGLSDSAPGALIPYMEAGYGIGYAIVSLIFVTNAAGFIGAAFVTDALLARLGRARTLVLSELIMIAGYVIIVCTPPFAGVVAAFFFLGFGCAINLALNNVFCSNLDRSTVILGMAHGSYGIGGTVGPVAATALASSGMLWSRFYFVTLGIRVACVAFNAWAFWNHEKENAPVAEVGLLAELQKTAASRQAAEGTPETAQQQQQPPKEQSKKALLKQALRNRVTVIGALFIFMYQGAEVAIAGWVISFLINYRGGEPAQVGYVTAGFFGGITLGRFTLTPLCHRFGEKRAVFALTLGALVLDVLVWLVPNLISNTIFVSLCGLLLGPVYPCAQTIFTRLLPRSIQTTSVGFIASAGSSGGAVMPLLTGLLAQAAGTWVLHPVCVGAFVGMLAGWAVLPRVEKRRE